MCEVALESLVGPSWTSNEVRNQESPRSRDENRQKVKSDEVKTKKPQAKKVQRCDEHVTGGHLPSLEAKTTPRPSVNESKSMKKTPAETKTERDEIRSPQ